MLRWLGVSLVLFGSVLLAVEGSRVDFQVASLPGPLGSHGLHALEVVGFAVVAAGLAALWKVSRGS